MGRLLFRAVADVVAGGVGFLIGAYCGIWASLIIPEPDKVSEVDFWLAAPMFGLIVGAGVGAIIGVTVSEWLYRSILS